MRSVWMIGGLLGLVGACDPAPGGASGDKDATPSETRSAPVASGDAPKTDDADGTTCTPNFTPHQKGAEGCSADHTVCRQGADGQPECHGGAIRIACGETGERCGKTFYCDCGDDGKKGSRK